MLPCPPAAKHHTWTSLPSSDAAQPPSQAAPKGMRNSSSGGGGKASRPASAGMHMKQGSWGGCVGGGGGRGGTRGRGEDGERAIKGSSSVPARFEKMLLYSDAIPMAHSLSSVHSDVRALIGSPGRASGVTQSHLFASLDDGPEASQPGSSGPGGWNFHVTMPPGQISAMLRLMEGVDEDEGDSLAGGTAEQMQEQQGQKEEEEEGG